MPENKKNIKSFSCGTVFFNDNARVLNDIGEGFKPFGNTSYEFLSEDVTNHSFSHISKGVKEGGGVTGGAAIECEGSERTENGSIRGTNTTFGFSLTTSPVVTATRHGDDTNNKVGDYDSLNKMALPDVGHMNIQHSSLVASSENGGFTVFGGQLSFVEEKFTQRIYDSSHRAKGFDEVYAEGGSANFAGDKTEKLQTSAEIALEHLQTAGLNTSKALPALYQTQELNGELEAILEPFSNIANAQSIHTDATPLSISGTAIKGGTFLPNDHIRFTGHGGVTAGNADQVAFAGGDFTLAKDAKSAPLLFKFTSEQGFPTRFEMNPEGKTNFHFTTGARGFWVAADKTVNNLNITLEDGTVAQLNNEPTSFRAEMFAELGAQKCFAKLCSKTALGFSQMREAVTHGGAENHITGYLKIDLYKKPPSNRLSGNYDSVDVDNADAMGLPAPSEQSSRTLGGARDEPKR